MKAFHWWAAALATLLADAALATGYTALDVTPADTFNCMPRGLNRSGQVVGHTGLPNFGPHRGFVTGPAGADARLIDTLGGSDGSLSKINDLGQAVGQAALPGDVDYQAIVVEPGATVPTPVGTPGKTIDAQAINNKGRIVGRTRGPTDSLYYAYITTGRHNRPQLGGVGQAPSAVLSDGTVAGSVDTGVAWRGYITGPHATGSTLLGTLGGKYTFVYGMNKHRIVVGTASNADDSWRHAFVTEPGGTGLRDLGLPGTSSAAHAINKHGKIVGSLSLDLSRWFAFVAQLDGSWTALDSLVTLPGGATLTTAFDINDAGQIVAVSSNGRCYLLTPTP